MKVWRLPYRTPDGRQTSRLFDTKGDAEKFWDDLRSGTRSGTWVAPDAGQERFVDFAQEYAEGQDWAPSTRESFGSVLRCLVRYLGPTTRVDQIDQLRLKKLRAELGREYALNTANIRLHYATTIMRTAYETNRIPRDVTLGVKPLKRRGDDADPPVGPDNVPTRDELLAIIAATAPRHRAMVVLGACGLRVAEAMGTTVGQLDLEHHRLAVDRQLVRIDGRPTFKRPKREKVRTISLPSWAVLELRRHLRDQGPFWALRADQEGDLLFRGRRDASFRRFAVYEAVWKPALQAAELADDRYVFHSLRHWCASSLLAAGAPITAVAGHLGERSRDRDAHLRSLAPRRARPACSPARPDARQPNTPRGVPMSTDVFTDDADDADDLWRLQVADDMEFAAGVLVEHASSSDPDTAERLQLVAGALKYQAVTLLERHGFGERRRVLVGSTVERIGVRLDEL